MWNRSLGIVSLTIQTLRSNPLHTLLSMLGLIIGVGALVAILSLGDSLEQYGRDQISTTTTLEAIVVTSKTVDRVDGVSLKRDTVSVLDLDNGNRLATLLIDRADVGMQHSANVEIAILDDSIRTGAVLYGVSPVLLGLMRTQIEFGRLFTDADMQDDPNVVVLSRTLAERLARENEPGALIGRRIPMGEFDAEVIGVLEAENGPRPPIAYAPYTIGNYTSTSSNPPTMVVRAKAIEEVSAIKEEVGLWLDDHVPGGREAFSLVTNQARVEQMEKGVRVFKLIMGLITGIAVLVGGIGVMNVMLISITERTREIGIRKATGARKRDIVLQFLTEAVAISIIGSSLGVLLGLGFMAIALPVIKQIMDVPPFEIAFSMTSLGIIAVVAILVGIGFGTYPAMRAARLSPIEAIRHE